MARTARQPTRSFAARHSLMLTAVFMGMLAGLIWIWLPGDADPLFYTVTPENPIPDKAVTNDRLSEATKISIAPYHGPESIVYWQGSIYTGVEEGKILKVTNTGVTVFADLHRSEYGSRVKEGRPLGMRLSSDTKELLVLHSSLGLFSVSLSNDSVHRIFPTKDEIRPMFFDDFDVLPNGTIILSEVSTKYTFKQLLVGELEGRPNGRLISVNPESGEWSTIIDGLDFPNGVQLHSDGQSVLVADTRKLLILRLPLNGGSVSVFADGLPGKPDNIRPSPRGGYWVPVSLLRDSIAGKITIWMGQWPRLRGALIKIIQALPMHISLESDSSMLLRLNDEGQVVEVWRDPEGLIYNVAEVCEYGTNIYTSSFFLPFIGNLSVA